MSSESSSNTAPPSPPFCGLPMTVHNVILFGETGVGKSSVVNMLLGERKAQTSTSARGCTFASDPYDVDLGDGVSVRIHDTAGLDESSAGKVSPDDAVSNLYNLFRKMEDGISLLIFVTRLGRITRRNQKNYCLFFKGICQSRVPIVLVVTHGEDACEDDDDDIEEAMDRWWDDNNQHFQSNGMTFQGQAVIVATKKGYQKEYEKSRQKVRDLVRSTHLPTPWEMEGVEWFIVSIRYIFSLLGWAQSHLKLLLPTLSTNGMLEGDAKIFVDKVATAMDPPTTSAASDLHVTESRSSSNPVTPILPHHRIDLHYPTPTFNKFFPAVVRQFAHLVTD